MLTAAPSGAGGQSMSRGGLKGLAFTATPSELVVAGHQDLVRARWSEAGVAEELLLSALPQHGPLALLERLEASGDVVALRLESQLRGVDSQDCLFRLAPGFTPVTAPTSKAKVRATPKARRSTTG